MTEETQALVDRLRDANPNFWYADLCRDAAAALTTLARDLETARQCPDCRQPLVCPAGTAERIAGLEAMHDETLTRAERAEDAVRAAVDREMTARQALADLTAEPLCLLRDYEAMRQERDAALANRDGLKQHADELHAKAQEAESRAIRLLGAYEAQQQLTVEAEDALIADVRAARAETWAEAAAWHEGMAEASVIPSLRPLHQQYAANFRERARLAAREGQ